MVPGSARIEDSRGLCSILLSKAPGVADTVQKIREGVIRNISVGYWIHKIVKTEGDDGTVARWDVTDWEPLEVSAVPIPADPGSQVRSEQQQDGAGTAALRSCVLVTPDPPASVPKQKARKEHPMATRTSAKPAKRPAKRAAEMTEDEKRLAQLQAAERAAERAGGKRDDDDDDDKKKDDDCPDDERDDGMDEEREGKESDEGEDEPDDKRDDGDEGAEEDEGDAKDDKRIAPGKRKALTEAEVRKAAEAAVRADRVRGSKIREIAAQFGYPKLGERHANGETSVRAFKDLVLERLAERQKKRGNTTFAATGTPEADEARGVRAQGGPAHARDYDKGADEARALLGKKAA